MSKNTNVVYGIYNDSNELMYVGITNNLKLR